MNDVQGCVAVVSKCPTPGKSKTRLLPRLGREGSASVAKAMLSDVLVTLSNCSLLNEAFKVLLYAPGNDDGLVHMRKILESLALEEKSTSAPRGWILLPLISTNLKASDLGAMLADALQRTREITSSKGGVVFLGMDAPELPLEEIVCGLRIASTQQKAFLCPADDGGYGMLCVPPQAPCTVFENVRWSSALTAVSQLKALTDHGIDVVLGRMMHDIDEPRDLEKLAERLCQTRNTTNRGGYRAETRDRLTRSSALSLDIEETLAECSYSWDMLQNLGIVGKRKCSSTDSEVFETRIK